MSTLKKYVPILNWLPGYSKDQFKGDLPAGLTIGVMLIPQGMAYALIAGMPPIYGLYAALVPLIIYAFLGSSRQLSVGPVAMDSLLVAAGVGLLAPVGSMEYISLAITLAFLVGLIQFLFGFLKLGFLVNFLSKPVISGFTSAAAIVISLNQFKHLLGIDLARSNQVQHIVIEVFAKIGEVHLVTFLLGLGGIILLITIGKISKVLPSQLILVVVGISLVYLLGLADNGIAVLGNVPSGLPSFQLPIFNFEVWGDLITIALTIALIAFMEAYSVAKAVQSNHNDYKIRPNQELIALGAANMGGSFFQAFPVAGSFSRTAISDRANAKTGMASIISAIVIAVTLLFLTSLFYYLPNAILASIIIVAVSGLIDFKMPRFLWKSNRVDFWMLLVTFLGTLFLGIKEGIAIGVLLSILMVVYRSAYPHMASLGRVPGTRLYRNLNRFTGLEERPDLLVVRLDAQMYFANSDYFKEKILKWVEEKGKDLKLVVVNAEAINSMDSTAVHTLTELHDVLLKIGIRLNLVYVKGPVRDQLFKAGFVEKVGDDCFFLHVQEAVEYYDDKSSLKYEKMALQTNAKNKNGNKVKSNKKI